MSFYKKLLSHQMGGYIKFFGLKKWYLSLTPPQQSLLHQVQPDLTSASISSTSETVGQFISSCAGEVAHYDIDFAEQLYHKALELESNPVHCHYILMRMADFYKELSNSTKWLKTIQDDLALLPTFAKAWSKQERISLPAYPAIDTMLRIFQNRGDLPEALSLCKQAQKLKVAGDWDRQIDGLQLKMQD